MFYDEGFFIDKGALEIISEKIILNLNYDY